MFNNKNGSGLHQKLYKVVKNFEHGKIKHFGLDFPEKGI